MYKRRESGCKELISFWACSHVWIRHSLLCPVYPDQVESTGKKFDPFVETYSPGVDCNDIFMGYAYQICRKHAPSNWSHRRLCLRSCDCSLYGKFGWLIFFIKFHVRKCNCTQIIHICGLKTLPIQTDERLPLTTPSTSAQSRLQPKFLIKDGQETEYSSIWTRLVNNA